MRSAAALALALAAGVALATYDLRTDDTGIEVGLLLIVSIALAFVAPRRWWAIALLVGGFIPIFELWSSGEGVPAPSGGIALVFTVIGSLSGFGIARASRVDLA
ncbi:MAG TPA: hypothetical protein VGT60_00515 [Candidatus Limnocylindria bacterium]|nr:hypothetical protein [Candidatus Limnocylindria bacterium]